ncbi:MAG: baseplate J/gp47 family protein [Candidatus Pacebacteria bacterium]|nr:baseplate J/gp47 family protein [Candidatus Paceibacterota bacterium]
MAKKVIKDVFLKQKKEMVPLDKELENEKKNRSRILLRVFIFLAAATLIAGFGLVFVGRISSAVINITPHQELTEIDTTLKAYGVSSATSENLSFETMKMEIEETQVITPTGIAGGGQKASGKITIYNNYGTAPQTLVANTRFEAPDGKIYRISNAVTIPGKDSAEATVYADKPGEEYNIGIVDFKIPGLKGGPRYDSVYARSKTDMVGGTSGNSRVVRKEDLDNAKKNAEGKIKDKLAEYFLKQGQADYFLHKNAIKVEYKDDKNNPKVGDAAGATPLVYKTTGTATGYIMKKNDLSRAITNSNIRKIEKSIANAEEVSVDNLEDLDLNFSSLDSKNKQITLKLKGKARFVWKFDQKKLVDDLQGSKRKNYNKVLSSYDSIYSAKIISKPSWWRKLPKDDEKIQLNVIINKN